MNEFEKRLAKELTASGKEYREAYAESFANEYVATQIKVLRMQRDLTQKALADRIGTSQPRISKFEEQDYGKWSLESLWKLASEYGLWPKISFETYGALIREAAHFDPERLQRDSFEEDVEVRRWLGVEAPVDQRVAFHEEVKAWLARPEPDLSMLQQWLQGRRMPEYNSDDQTVPQYFHESIPPSDKSTWDGLAERLAALIGKGSDALLAVRFPSLFSENLYAMARTLGPRKELQDALDRAFQEAGAKFRSEGKSGLSMDGASAIIEAMIQNQTDYRWMPVWSEFVSKFSHPFLPGDQLMGMRGLLGLPPKDVEYWRNLARGMRDIERSFIESKKIENILTSLTQAAGAVFSKQDHPDSARHLLMASVELMKEGSWNDFAVGGFAMASRKEGWHDNLYQSQNLPVRRVLGNAIRSGLQTYLDWESAVKKQQKCVSTKATQAGQPKEWNATALEKLEQHETVTNEDLIIARAAEIIAA